MKYGDIILFKPTGLMGKLISKIDGSPYSHVGVFLEYDNGVPLFIESHEKKGGVVITKLQEWQNYTVLRPIKIKPRPKQELLELLGTGYDFSMLGWILKAKLFGKEAPNNSPTLLICSEFADYAYHYKIGNGRVATPKTFALSDKFIQI